MRTFATKTIRQLLRDNPDGLDVGTIANTVDREPSNVRKRLKEMPDAYIDRWEKCPRGYTAIWCVVLPPDHCPHPTKQVVAVRQSGRQATGGNAQTAATQPSTT